MLFGMQSGSIRGMADAAVGSGMTAITSRVIGTKGSFGSSSPLDLVGTALWLKLLSPLLGRSWTSEWLLGSL